MTSSTILYTPHPLIPKYTLMAYSNKNKLSSHEGVKCRKRDKTHLRNVLFKAGIESYISIFASCRLNVYMQSDLDVFVIFVFFLFAKRFLYDKAVAKYTNFANHRI